MAKKQKKQKTTARKPARRRPNLRESERNFRLLVEGVTDYAIFMLDPEGYVVNWNAGAERITGYKARQIVGKHFSVLHTPHDREAGLPAKVLQLSLIHI